VGVPRSSFVYVTGTECLSIAVAFAPLPNGFHRHVADSRTLHEQAILAQLESKGHVTQRALSSELGIALGLTNLVIRRLVIKGWVRIKRVSGRRLLYLITPAGVAAKADLTRRCFLDSLTSYRETRERMLERMAVVSGQLPASGAPHRVAFYGAGDAAEVAYLCLRDVGLELSGIVDATATGSFFHLHLRRPSELAGSTVGGQAFSRLIVMPLQDEAPGRAVLAAQQVPLEQVFWL
jgi:DNA-binding MarR family transcriptional regulator